MKKIFVFSILFLTANHAISQLLVNDSLLTKVLETDVLLPMLIDSAIKNSPEVNRIDNSIGFAKENLEVNKRSIYDALSLFSSYSYGTTGNVTAGSLSTFTTSQTNYYNAGIGLQLPLSRVLSRKHVVRSGEYQIKMAQSEKENAALYVKQEVIRLYQEFKLAQRLVFVAGDGKQTALVNYNMSQKQFLQNDIALTELSRVQDIYTKAAIEFESDVNRFQTSSLQLEAYTGVKLANLITSIK
jgi:outer membrane protein TolC